MTKCGKGCMPECEYFTTGGCISPFNCPYRIEELSPNSATSASSIYVQNLISENAVLKTENAALQKRLKNAVELPCKVGDTVWFFDSGRILKEGKISMLQCKSGGNWKMRITHNLTYSQCKSVFDDYCSKLGIEYFTDRAEAEARLAELKGGRE